MKLICHTDGSYCRHSKAAGWAYTVSASGCGHLEKSGSYFALDNNDVEARALYEATKHLHEIGVKNVSVVLYSDSDNACKSFNQTSLLEAGAASVEVKYVPAHKGAKNAVSGANEYVDRLAKYAMRELRDAR